MDVNSFLNFDKMLTPTIIKIVFWIGVGISVLMGLILIVSGITSYLGGGIQVVTGLAVIVLGPIGVRIYCELLIIFFKMQDSLNEMKSMMDNQSETPKVEE